MKSIHIAVFLLSVSLFTNCSTAQKLQNSAPMTFGDVVYQNWVAGVKGGGSGTNLFISILEKPTNVQLDSVYFRGKVATLEMLDDHSYVGRFKTNFNQQTAIIKSDHRELANQKSNLEDNFPFELKDTECVISYQENGATKYFKIKNITEKPAPNYPSVNKHQE